MQPKKVFEKIFNSEGNFTLKNFDPYRIGEDKKVLEFRNLLFSEDGDLHGELIHPLREFIKEKNLSPFCDAVKCMYAEEHGSGTKGSYPAIYMWR